MQNIVLRLVFRGTDLPAVSDVSPWVDRRRTDFTPISGMLADQTHRRILKCHLPLDGMSYHPGTRYIVIVRDARDVFMSLWNHLSNLTDQAVDAVNAAAHAAGEAGLARPDEIHAFWKGWINRGTFPWESEGYPHSANLAHTQSWWTFRHLKNIHFVHFSHLLSDPQDEIRGVARHLGIDLSDAAIAAIARDTHFSALRRNPGQTGPMSADVAEATWVGGLKRFFFQGTNGRWRSVLTPPERAMYDRPGPAF